jgi:DivIVA domain-containing protein
VVEEYLEGQEKLSIDEVRDLKFKLQRGGYIESQVDSYIDRLVEYIQAERFGRPFVAPSPSASNVVWGYPDPTDPGFQAY